MPKQIITYASSFRNCPIQTDALNGLGCIENILAAFHDQLSYMTNRYTQVTVMELVVTPPASIPVEKCNQVIGDCLRAIRKTMHNNGIACQYSWTREVGHCSLISGKLRPHYNVCIMIDGSKCQSSCQVASSLQLLIAKRSPDAADTGNVHRCCYQYDEQNLHPIEKASSIKIRQDRPNAHKQFKNVFNRFSYNCKTTQKGHASPGQREFGFSRLPSHIRL